MKDKNEKKRMKDEAKRLKEEKRKKEEDVTFPRCNFPKICAPQFSM